MRNFDEQIPLAQGSDDGQDTPESVQPIRNGEYVWNEFTNRPTENLRQRTEILRAAIERGNYFLDSDRALLLFAEAPLAFTQPASGRYALALSTSGSLWVYPALTPGRHSGGRARGGVVFCSNSAASDAWTPYSGTPGVDDLVLVASAAATGQRGYADTDNFADAPAGRSIGANRVQVVLVADSGSLGGPGSISAVVAHTPATRVTITYGTGSATSLSDLINFINADRSSQGAYGVGDLLYASTTGSSSNAPTPFSDGAVQGAYDAEAHEVTKAQLDGFFAATDGGGAFVNRMQEGETLAIGYPLGPVESGVSSPVGGRRQSLFDLPTDRIGGVTQNTTPSAGWSLFVTGREPEKIPGSLPLGKVINGEFVCIDGTRIGGGETLSLGESRTMWLLLASLTGGQSGARRVGFEGVASWNADAVASSSPALPADTAYATFMRIAADLARASTGQSGARRVGSEAVTGTASLGNAPLSLTAGSLREQIAQLLNGTGALNGRVNEAGHRLTGPAPLRKEFAASGMPAAGAVMFQAELHAPVDLWADTPIGAQEFQNLNLQPIVYSNPGDADDFVTLATTAAFGSATSLFIAGMTLAQFGKVFAQQPVYGLGGREALFVFVKIANLAGCADATDGIYVIFNRTDASRLLAFRRLDGSSPDFTGLSSTPTITLMSGSWTGADWRYTRFGGYFPNHVVDNGVGSPVALIGLAGNDSRLLEVYLPASPASSVKSITVFGNRVEFRSPQLSGGNYAGGTTYPLGQTVTYSGIIYVSIAGTNVGHQPDISPSWWTPAPYITRSTNDILVPADKALLSGGETLAPKDATANHHHGSTYASFTSLVARGVAAAPISGLLTSLPGAAFPVTPLAGTANVGVVIYYEFYLQYTASGDEVVAYEFTDATGRLLHVVEIRHTSAGMGDASYVKGSATVPLAGNQYYLRRHGGTNIDLTLSTFFLDYTAMHAVKV